MWWPGKTISLYLTLGRSERQQIAIRFAPPWHRFVPCVNTTCLTFTLARQNSPLTQYYNPWRGILRNTAWDVSLPIHCHTSSPPRYDLVGQSLYECQRRTARTEVSIYLLHLILGTLHPAGSNLFQISDCNVREWLPFCHLLSPIS